MRILLIDSHVDSLRVFKRSLERGGHDVVATDTLAGGLALCAAGVFELVISELRLSDGDGATMAHAARRLGVRAITLTTQGFQKDIERALAAGFEKLLVKPIRPDHLLQAIKVVSINEVSCLGDLTRKTDEFRARVAHSLPTAFGEAIM